jgi:DNA-binding LytR/AlgR family response regulator
MLLKCVAIDKDLTALELISNYLEGFPALKLLQTFDDVLTGGEFLRYNRIDLLFIELNMPGNSAIELVRSIQEKLLIIFTIGSKQLPREILELNALDYLIKPIAFERFASAVDKAVHHSQHENQLVAGEVIYIRSTYQLIKINLDEIEYIESVENYIKFHLSNGKSVMTLMPLKIIIEKLPQERFVRIHRGYIIAIDKIKYIGNKKIKMSTIELPVGDTYLMNLAVLIKK